MARPNQARPINSEVGLAERIKYEREQRDWTYEGLAKRMTDAGCSINASALYKIEKGDPPRRINVDELVALSRVFEIGVDELVTPIRDFKKALGEEIGEKYDRAADSLGKSLVEVFEALFDFMKLAAWDLELWGKVNDRNKREDFSTSVAEDVPLIGAIEIGGKPWSYPEEPLREAVIDVYRAMIGIAGDAVEESLRQERGRS